MTYLIAFILGLTTIFAPTSATLPTYLTEVSTTPAPVVEAPASVVEGIPDPINPQQWLMPEDAECLEDMPCWSPDTMGNKLSGPQVATNVPNMEGDAYASFDALGTDPAPYEGMMLTYVASFTSAPQNFATGEFAVPSVQTEGLYHVLRWDTMHSA